MNNALISVIIPNYNGLRFLPFCLNSLKSQRYSPFEVIVVDNGSQDNSIQFVKENCPQVKIIELNRNYGFAYAVNRGIENSSGSYVALLNNDAVADKYWLIELVEPFKYDTDIVITTSLMKLSKNKKSLIDGAGDIMSVYGYPYKRGFLEKDIGQYNRDEYIFSGCGGASMYKKEFFKVIGLFDEDFFAYFEDVDLSFRAHIHGYKCYYAHKSIVYHCHHGTSRKNPKRLVYLSARNINYILIKNMPCKIIIKYWYLYIIRCFMFLKNLIQDIYFAPQIIKGNLDFLLNLNKMIKKRKKILSNKKIKDDELLKILWHGPESEGKINELTNFISLFLLFICASFFINIFYLVVALIIIRFIKKTKNNLFNIFRRKFYHYGKKRIEKWDRSTDFILGNMLLLFILYYIFSFPAIICTVAVYIITREIIRIFLRWSYSR